MSKKNSKEITWLKSKVIFEQDSLSSRYEIMHLESNFIIIEYAF